MADHEEFLPYEAIPPGETLGETIDSLGISQAELVRRMNRPAKTINEIINGKAAITADTAIQLERVLGISASFWNNLERNYQLTLARLRAEEDLQHQATLVDRFPYAEMARYGWVTKATGRRERARALLRFFAINSLDRVRLLEPAAFRRSRRRKASPEALAAWLRQGSIEGRQIETKPFSEAAFRSALAKIRRLTASRSLAFGAAADMCAASGVAIVAVPHLSRTYVNGATRWLGPDKALMQLSLRYPFEDVFWFTFFHEAGHILQHGKKEVIVESQDGQNSQQEQEANAFAANVLIPTEEYAGFVKYSRRSASEIRGFAQELGIAPSIVVGRLQFDGHIPYSHFNHLRRKLVWVERP